MVGYDGMYQGLSLSSPAAQDTRHSSPEPSLRPAAAPPEERQGFSPHVAS